MSNKDIKPVGRKANIVIQDYANEVLIYDLTENKAFSLNEMSASIWQLCDGKNSVSDISKSLTRKYGASIDNDFVLLGLEQLKENNLLENTEEVFTDLNGLSRREVIRKVGFASLVALPLVSSLIAPKAAHAASASAVSCTANGQCTSGCCGATAAGAANQFCVTPGLDPTASYCRAGCECQSACCVGNACQPGNLAPAQPCTTACQCASKSCNTIANTCN
jgi:hypothetical protein